MLRRSIWCALCAFLLCAVPAFAAKRALFENFHAETAGNADWTIDDNQPTPSPAQSAIVPSTPRTYWNGAISSWGVDLVKRGFTVTINTAALTYGVASNPLDLTNFDVLIVPEPNTLFSASEKTAIFNFVRDGGGLVGIGDHDGSDRNSDGIDSPKAWNDLDPTFLLGVHWGTTGDLNNNIVQTSSNVRAAASDSVTRGVEGNVAALAFHNGTTFTLHPEVNPTVRGEVWMTGLAQTSLTGVMAATAQYGSGRVFFCGDSSPIDDGSAQAGNTSIFDGWGEVADSLLFMNATQWASRRDALAGDFVPPSITLAAPNGGENWKAGTTQAITWTASDNVAVTSVDLAYSTDAGATYPNTIASGLANTGSFNWSVPLANSTTVRVRATARDAANNSAADASNANFTLSRWTVIATGGLGGSVTPGGTTGVLQGANVTVTITPNANFHIANVIVDGVQSGPLTSVTFTNITANHTVAAAFAADAYTLTTAAIGVGTVDRDLDQPTYDFGTLVTLTATPGSGWAFTGWSGDASGSTNPLEVTIDAPKSVTATFADVEAPVVNVTAPLGGEVWDVNTVHAITWTASDNAAVDSVRIEYSAGGSAGPWQQLAQGLANSGTFDWTVLSAPTDSGYVRVTAYDPALHTTTQRSVAAFQVRDANTGVGARPTSLQLSRPWPNPAHGTVRIGFGLPEAATAQLSVHDVSGRVVWSRSESLAAGSYDWRWDGRDANGRTLGAGLYLVRLATPYGTRHVRLAWVR